MYKENYIFPAIISKLADDDYNVKFADFEEIITYGTTLEEAYDMAEEALKLEIFDLYADKLDIPLATDINKIKTNDVETIILVRVNLVKILKEYDNRSVKKTLTIPSWMNEMAESKKINFSQVLQEALKNKLEL